MTTKRIDDYIVIQSIGSGSFARVRKAYHSKTRLNVAIKSIREEKLKNKKHQDNLEFEISILRKLEHKNIVRLYDVKKTKSHIHLILEYCGGGDLSKALKTEGGPFSELLAQRLLKQLAAGLQFLRFHQIIHRDLKPQNLLLDTEKLETATLKIADFGFARHIQPDTLAATLCGSPLYMAPEVLESQRYDEKADLWSVGAIMYEMVVGKPPFNATNIVDLLKRIKSTTEISFPSHLKLSPECKDLIKQLLVINPRARMTYDKFFSHPFVQLPSQDFKKSPDAAAATASRLTPDPEPTPTTESKIPESKPFTRPVVTQVWPRSMSTPPFTPLLGPTPPSPLIIDVNNKVVPPPLSLDYAGEALSNKPKSESKKIETRPRKTKNEDEYVFIDPAPSTGTEQETTRSYKVAPDEVRRSLILDEHRGASTHSVALESKSQPSKPIITSEADMSEEISGMFQRAVKVAMCGDDPSWQEDSPDSVKSALSSLSLYVKALSLFEMVMQKIKECKQELAATDGSGKLMSKLDSYLEEAIRKFQSCYKKAEQTKQNILDTIGYSPDDDETEERPRMLHPVPMAEKLLYNFALTWAKDAAVEEMIGNTTKAIKTYSSSYLLFQQLSMEQNTTPTDRALLNSLLEDISSRIDTLSTPTFTRSRTST